MPPRFGIAAPKCARCDKSVYQAEQVIGPAAKAYHKSCLTCMVCNKRLDSTLLLEHEGEAYCKNCHRAHLGQGKGGFGTAVPLNAELPRSPPPGSAASPTAASRGSTEAYRTASPTINSVLSSPVTATRSSRPNSPSKLSGRVLADDFDRHQRESRREEREEDPMLDLADEVSQIHVSSRPAAPPTIQSSTEQRSSRSRDPPTNTAPAVRSIDDAIYGGHMPQIISRSAAPTAVAEEDNPSYTRQDFSTPSSPSRPADIEPLAPEAGLPVPNKYMVRNVGSSGRQSSDQGYSSAYGQEDPNYKPSAADVIAAVRAGRLPGSPKKESPALGTFDASNTLQEERDRLNRATIGSVPAPVPASYNSPSQSRGYAYQAPEQPSSSTRYAATDRLGRTSPTRQATQEPPSSPTRYAATDRLGRTSPTRQTTASTRAPAFEAEESPRSQPARFEPPTTRVAATSAYSSGSGRLPSPTRPNMAKYEPSAKMAPRTQPAAAVVPDTPPRTRANTNNSSSTTSSPSFSAGINRLGLSSTVTNASTARSGTPLCARCGKAVYFAEQLQASGRKWHRGCLKCDGCGTTLDPGKLEEGPAGEVKSGCNTWCRVCYAKYFGPKGELRDSLFSAGRKSNHSRLCRAQSWNVVSRNLGSLKRPSRCPLSLSTEFRCILQQRPAALPLALLLANYSRRINGGNTVY